MGEGEEALRRAESEADAASAAEARRRIAAAMSVTRASLAPDRLADIEI